MLRVLTGGGVTAAESNRPPVWIMRQAGRYMAEYRAVKEKHSFLEICRSPELAVQVSLQPLHYLDVDAAIIFSDILIPAALVGLEVDFNPGPVVKNPLRTQQDLQGLKRTDLSAVDFLGKAISQLRKYLNEESRSEPRALLGFAGAPWTMLCYLLDQKPYKHFERSQIVAREHPQAVHTFLELMTDLLTDYLLMQVEAGADAVQLFDTWAGNLSVSDYRQFAAPYTAKIFDRLKTNGVPTILYVNNSNHLLEAMAETSPTCISLDWRSGLGGARRRIPQPIKLQGNLDPTQLFGTVEEVEARTSEMLNSITDRAGYIANLGHGILQTTPPENALTFVKRVKEGWR